MKRNYFEGIKYELNELIAPADLKMNVPEGFGKSLNSIETLQLINDQLLEKGLELDNTVFTDADGKAVHRIVTAGKKAKHIENNPNISKRLREYLDKFNR